MEMSYNSRTDSTAICLCTWCRLTAIAYQSQQCDAACRLPKAQLLHHVMLSSHTKYDCRLQETIITNIAAAPPEACKGEAGWSCTI